MCPLFPLYGKRPLHHAWPLSGGILATMLFRVASPLKPELTVPEVVATIQPRGQRYSGSWYAERREQAEMQGDAEIKDRNLPLYS